MEFDNTSQRTWEEMNESSPFAGPKKDEGKYTADFYGTTREEFVDYDLLEEFINIAAYDRNYTRFNYRNYAVNEDRFFNQGRQHPLFPLKYLDANAGFTYLDINRKERVAGLSVRLNKRVDDVAAWAYAHWITINGNQKKISATFYVYYAGTDSEREPIRETASETDFTIDNKYVAIKINTPVLRDFFVLFKSLTGNADQVIKKTIDLFASELKKAKSAESISFLYSQIPPSIIEKVASSLSKELLMKHLYTLKSADDANWFSDESSPILIILQMLCNGNPAFLYDLCVRHPRIVKELYYNMHGESRINGTNYPNRFLFANLMLVLGLINGFRDMKKTGHVYKVGKGYFPDSNVDETNDKYVEGIFLQQYQSRSRDIETYEYIYRVARLGKVTDDFAVTDGHYYYPMSPLKLIDLNAEEGITNLVPAIFIKYLADTEEWKEIMTYVRIGLNLLAIVLGVLSLGTTSGLFFALAVADIGLASADTLVVLNGDLFKNSPEGRAFLETWDKIMLVGGIATASPLLIRGAFKQGVAACRLVENSVTREFIKKSLVTIIKEINPYHAFIQQSFRVIDKFEELMIASNYAFKKGFLQNLMNADAVFLGKINQATQKLENQFAVVYEGEIIAKGNSRTVVKQLKELNGLKGEKLVKELEEFRLMHGQGKYHVKGFLESEVLTAKEIAAWERKFKLLAGYSFRLKSASHNRQVLKYMESQRSLAFFDAEAIPPIVWYRDNPTNYILQHEYWHVEEFITIGKKEYLKGVNGTIEERFHNTIMREKYVYQKILENKHLFSKGELIHADWYYTQEVIKAAKAGVETIPEYLIN